MRKPGSALALALAALVVAAQVIVAVALVFRCALRFVALGGVLGDGQTAELEAAGLFVYVGLAPATAWLDRGVMLDASGRILVDGNMRTAVPGIFAAGTVRAGSAGRAASAAGDGAVAALSADRYLRDGIW